MGEEKEIKMIRKISGPRRIEVNMSGDTKQWGA
jgi:hypothetical protein